MWVVTRQKEHPRPRVLRTIHRVGPNNFCLEGCEARGVVTTPGKGGSDADGFESRARVARTEVSECWGR